MNKAPVNIRFDGSEPVSFEKIYLQLHNKLYYFALSIVGEETARDMVQETFYQLLLKGEFKNAKHLEGIAMLTIRHLCINELQSCKSRKKRVEKYQEAQLLTDSHFQNGATIRTLVLELIEPVLLKMAAIDIKIIHLYITGFQVQEIATLMNLQPKTISNRMTRFKQVLREQVSEKEYSLVLAMLVGLEAVCTVI